MTNQTCDMFFHPNLSPMHPIMLIYIGGCMVPHASFCIMFSWLVLSAQPHLASAHSLTGLHMSLCILSLFPDHIYVPI